MQILDDHALSSDHMNAILLWIMVYHSYQTQLQPLHTLHHFGSGV